MTDWESDPELKALRDEFIESFPARRRALAPWLQQVRAAAVSAPGEKVVLPSALQEPLSGVRIVAHKIAGSSESFGFTALGKIGAAIDDLLDERAEALEKEASDWAAYSELLDLALAEAHRKRADPRELLERDDARALISEAERLASEARPE